MLKSIASFLNNNNLIIRPSDKNLGITILNKTDYLKEAFNLLNDQNTYLLINDPKGLQNTIEKGLRMFIQDSNFTKEEKDYILYKINDCKIPEFYIIPKIHKSPISYRPIVASNSWITTNLSKIISDKLLKYMDKCPFILKDSKSLIMEMNKHKTILDNKTTGIITIDIESLYTNMKISLIEEEFRDFLQDDNLLDAILFVLQNNLLTFANRTYKQKNGMAMGTNMAVLVANIYCHLLIDKKISRSPTFTHNTIMYRRYIDDIIIFISNKNYKTEDIKRDLELVCPHHNFTYSKIQDKQPFLDLEISITSTFPNTQLLSKPNFGTQIKSIQYNVFQKASNLYAYIGPSSCHPSSLKRSFIKAELLRYARNSSTLQAFTLIRSIFHERLLRRGYSRKYLFPIFQQVQYSERNKLLEPKTNNTNTKTPIVITYSPIIPTLQVKQLLLQKINECEDLCIKTFLLNQNFILAYRSQRNILKHLSKASLLTPITILKPKAIKNPIQITLEDFEMIKRQRIDMGQEN